MIQIPQNILYMLQTYRDPDQTIRNTRTAWASMTFQIMRKFCCIFATPVEAHRQRFQAFG